MTLVDAENFRAFEVVAEKDGQELAAALAGIGEVDAEGAHVFLDAEAVKGLAGKLATPEWVTQFEGMIEFARSKGWVDEAGRVRAHVERPDGSAAG